MTYRKYTNGPWSIKFRDDDSSYICMGGLNPGQNHKQFNLLLERGNGNDEHDAHLIAAAPDLYEALYRLTIECIIEGKEKEAGYDCWIHHAKSAMAKARGEE